MYDPLCRPDAELVAKLVRMINALTSPETLKFRTSAQRILSRNGVLSQMWITTEYIV